MSEPQTYITTNFEREETFKESFIGGTLGELTDESTGGGSAAVSSGQAVLSTGTAATGDKGRISLHNIMARHDALLFRVNWELGSDATSDTDAYVTPALIDGDASSQMQHFINRSKLRTANSGDLTTQNVANLRVADTPLTTELFWEFDERVSLRFQNAWRARQSTTLPSKFDTYEATMQIVTNDTAADRAVRVNEFEVSYWSER